MGRHESNAKADAAKEPKTTTITAHFTNSRHVDPLACMHLCMHVCGSVCAPVCVCLLLSLAWSCLLSHSTLLLGFCPTTFVCTFRLRFIYYALLLIFAISHLNTRTHKGSYTHTCTRGHSSTPCILCGFQQLHPLPKQKRLFISTNSGDNSRLLTTISG